MANHHCQTLAVTCIDFRFQEYINRWISENLPPKSYDRVALAGCVRNFDITLEQIRISKRLHDIKEVVLINHEDCGAYIEQDTHEKHSRDLRDAKAAVKSEFPDLKIKTFYLHLDGSFEEVA